MSALWEADELAAALGLARGFAVSGISIDTRSLAPGDLFVALQGERDGHDFVEAAFAKGAAAALVSRDMPGNVLVVADTLASLGRLGAAARARSAAKIVAVTGSVGKTTTKEMLRTALGGFGRVHAAEASFNNHIGVPLTLARMPRETEFGVFEIGMNHPGEIAPLAALVRPDVAIITCVDRAHLGLMGSEEAIAVEKAAIFSGLAAGGTAVLPGESRFLALLRAAVPAWASQIVFGGANGDVCLTEVKEYAEGTDVSASLRAQRSNLSFRPAATMQDGLLRSARNDAVSFRLAAPGRHMAMNALAVLAAVDALGLDVARAAGFLNGFAPFAGRGARRLLRVPGGEILLLDESYNASGASMRAALSVLGLQPGRRVAVLGDMLELGEFARAEHLALRPAVMEGAELVFACGEGCGALFDSLPAGMRGGTAADAPALAPMVAAALRPGDAVLVKGSHGSNMRAVIRMLEGVEG